MLFQSAQLLARMLILAVVVVQHTDGVYRWGRKGHCGDFGWANVLMLLNVQNVKVSGGLESYIMFAKG